MIRKREEETNEWKLENMLTMLLAFKRHTDTTQSLECLAGEPGDWGDPVITGSELGLFPGWGSLPTGKVTLLLSREFSSPEPREVSPLKELLRGVFDFDRLTPNSRLNERLPFTKKYLALEFLKKGRLNSLDSDERQKNERLCSKRVSGPQHFLGDTSHRKRGQRIEREVQIQT
uniref:Uncharacterized protein n=1 Tax=Amphimedon queenslandica TaxID=400682 RepID=A0A1X7VDU8_AMPQE